jgi:RNA polymerase sigma-70 factor (ECF subfamily)
MPKADKEQECGTQTADAPGALDSTLELIRRARNGDQEAIERLFARHLKPLQRWASGRLPQWARDLADTDDLVQDSLLQTFKRIGDFEPRRIGALQTYMRQAVLNRLRDELRRRARQPPIADVDALEDANTLSSLEHAIGRRAIEEYEEALGRLSSEDREVIIARVEIGYTYSELAEALGKPSAEAARKAARRALLRLAEEMKRAAR